MICSHCAFVADSQVRLNNGGRPKLSEPVIHPASCGCDCQHHPVGTRQIQKEKND